VKSTYKKYRLHLQKIFEAKGQNVEGSLPNMDHTCWCPRCVDYFNHCQASHNSRLLQLIGGLFTKQLMYRCREDSTHIFYISSLRKHAFQKQYRIQDYTCPNCKKI
jgi:hypothetical protein